MSLPSPFPKENPKQSNSLKWIILIFILFAASSWGIKSYQKISFSGMKFEHPIENANTLALGSEHACWIDRHQQTWCWGSNESGQLGDANAQAYGQAVQVDQNLISKFNQIFAYTDRTCAINTESELYCWGGWNTLGQEKSPLQLEQIPVDELKPIHENFRNKGISISPQKVNGLNENVSQAALGLQHSCALLQNNEVWCWGDNSLGQLAQPLSKIYTVQPKKITGLPDHPWKKLIAGPASSCVISAQNQAWCWGVDLTVQPIEGDKLKYLQLKPQHWLTVTNRELITRFNALDSIKPTPQPLIAVSNPIVDMVINLDFACALITTGEIECWGGNSYAAATGYQNQTFLKTALPINDEKFKNAAMFSTNSKGMSAYNIDHSCALIANDTAYCWGMLEHLRHSGYGSGLLIPLPPQKQWISLKSADEFDCAQTKQHDVYCWGRGLDGRAFNMHQSAPENFNAQIAYPLQPNGLTAR